MSAPLSLLYLIKVKFGIWVSSLWIVTFTTKWNSHKRKIKYIYYQLFQNFCNEETQSYPLILTTALEVSILDTVLEKSLCPKMCQKSLYRQPILRTHMAYHLHHLRQVVLVLATSLTIRFFRIQFNAIPLLCFISNVL